MIVNTVFTNGLCANSGVATRPQPRIVNPTRDNMRDIERAAEARGRMNSLSASLQSAMASLESANKDIDRLTQELQREREKNAGLKAGSMEDVTALKDEIRNLRADLEAAKAELQREREKNARAFPKGKKAKKATAALPELPEAQLETPES